MQFCTRYLISYTCPSLAGVRRWRWRIHQQLVVSLSEESTSSHWTTVLISEPQNLWVRSEVSSLTARKLIWAVQQIKSTLWKVKLHFVYTWSPNMNVVYLCYTGFHYSNACSTEQCENDHTAGCVDFAPQPYCKCIGGFPPASCQPLPNPDLTIEGSEDSELVQQTTSYAYFSFFMLVCNDS